MKIKQTTFGYVGHGSPEPARLSEVAGVVVLEMWGGENTYTFQTVGGQNGQHDVSFVCSVVDSPIEQARRTQRAALDNSQQSGAKLPESDRADMEVFFEKIAQLLPVLGSEVLVPVDDYGPKGSPEDALVYEVRDLKARGRRTESGFVVFEGSQAVEDERVHTQGRSRYIVSQREQLLAEGVLKRAKGHLRFTRNVEFTSPSTAASIICGGAVNGLIAWKDRQGRTLREIEGA